MCENKKDCSCGCSTKKPLTEAKKIKIPEIKKSDKILFEKIDLKLTSNTKRELVKQAKAALDALYSIYDISEKQNISMPSFLDTVDSSFENANKLLTLLVTQESVVPKT